ncbi:MAG: hypothetical protein ACRED7_03950 [Stellaceae bacterium]
MRSIKVSEEVWQEIAAKGKFGETEDDVLRRIFEIDSVTKPPSMKQSGRRGRGNLRYANKWMSARSEAGKLIVEFEDVHHEWKLPDRSDKIAIRQVRDAAIEFALSQGATDPGQTNAVRKALTSAGYHLTK